MNRKVIGSLLGGGVTAVVASFGGIKLKDNIDYNSKIRHFGGLRTSFNDILPKINSGFDNNWRIPRWENIEVWKELYNRTKDSNKINIGGWGTENVKTLSNPEELRDVCYKMISEKAKENYGDCQTSAGWCDTCLINKDWLQTWNTED